MYNMGKLRINFQAFLHGRRPRPVKWCNGIASQFKLQGQLPETVTTVDDIEENFPRVVFIRLLVDVLALIVHTEVADKDT